MNVLFVTISPMPDLGRHSISLDLIHEFIRNGHKVYVVCALERGNPQKTALAEEAGATVLRVKIGKNKKANLIEKGITTLTVKLGEDHFEKQVLERNNQENGKICVLGVILT